MKMLKIKGILVKILQIIYFSTLCVCEEMKKSDNTIKKKPHIVLIVADDMGWNDVSFHGANQIPTPNIDALAYNGVILNKHYVLPICTPSRSALMTGRYPIRDGMQGWPLKAGDPRALPSKQTLLPEYLRRLGYATSLIGKWHLGYYSPNHTPARRGFDYFYGYYNGVITYFDHWADLKLNNSKIIIGQDFHRDTIKDLRAHTEAGYFTDLITDQAVKIIQSHENDNPLFLEVAHLAVHASDSEVDPLEVRNMTDVNATFPYIKYIKRRKCAGMIKALDESVGKIVKTLEETKMLENSIIIFLSDNGAPTIGLYENAGSNYPLRGIKHTYYEGGIRSVACIYSPLIKKPSRLSEKLIHITDWLPTLYAAAGGSLADLRDIDGFNFWPHIVNNTESPRKFLLINIDEKTNNSGAIIGKYKLIKNAGGFGDGYYGESGNDPSYPPYKIQEVLLSPAGIAISRLKEYIKPSLKRIKRLRDKSTVKCEPVTSYANCTTLCLFNLQSDPCETMDLSERYPKISKKLNVLIDEYWKVLIPQIDAPVDPLSYPENFNGSWMPWIKDDYIPIYGPHPSITI